MVLTKLALNRPVSVILFIVTLSFFGITALFDMKMAYQPDVEMPMMIVVTPYLGADPAIIEATITKEVEPLGALVTGFKEVMSFSNEDMSTVVFSFDYEVDTDQTYMDLKTEVDQLNLPDDAGTPVIMEMAFDSTSMMSISISALEGEDALTFANDIIVPQLETQIGVADVEIYGGQEDYVRITLDPTRMKQYGLSMSGISSAISMYDFDLPLGSLDQGVQEIAISSGASLTSLAQLQEVSLTTGSGDLIKLKEVANIMIGAKPASSISRYNGNDNISVEIINAQDANIPDVSKRVLAALDLIIADNPGFVIEVTNNQSDLIIDTLMSVADTLVLGVVLCMFVLFVFFGDIRASLIVGSSIPMSLIITLITMNAFGFELNMITASALVIAIGMMVDNSIVVLESIFKVREEEPDGPLDLVTMYKGIAFRGTNLVSASVMASTITTIVVYLPLATMGGVSGQMFVHLSWTIVFAMIASLLSATVLVPMLYLLLKPRERVSFVTRLVHKMEHKYTRVVARVIRHKFITVFLAFLLLVGSFALLTQIPMVLLPSTDGGILNFDIEFRPNSKLEVMNDEISIIEDLIRADHRLDGYQLSISGSSGSISAYVADGYATAPLVNEYLEKTMGMANMSVDLSVGGDQSADMTGDLTLITTTLHGYVYSDVQAAAAVLEAELYEVPGVLRVSSSEGGWGSAKATIDIDPSKVLSFGLNPVSVAQILRQAVSGLDVLSMEIGIVEYDVILEYPEGYVDDLHHLMEMPIDTQMGQIPLSQMAELKFSDSVQSIKRTSGYYVIDLTVSPVPGMNTQVSSAVDLLENNNYGNGVYIGNGPGVDTMTEEMTALIEANFTAVFLVFMVMAMQFESVRFSMMVMTSVWFSFIGSFGLLFISGQPMTIVSMMGVLMLMGIVVNNGILFVDTANQLRKRHSMVEALILSGKTRMRPIIMTTMTTILSMIPLALAIGEGTEMMQSMGIIIIGGLVASTILVLFLMPTFYILISKKEKKPKPPKNPPDNPQNPELPAPPVATV